MFGIYYSVPNENVNFDVDPVYDRLVGWVLSISTPVDYIMPSPVYIYISYILTLDRAVNQEMHLCK